MFNKRTLFLAFLLTGISPAFAQKKALSLNEAVMGYWQFKPQSFDFVQPVPNSDNFSYIDKRTELRELFSAQGGKTMLKLKLEDLNGLLKSKGLDPTGMIPMDYQWHEPFKIRFNTGTHLVTATLPLDTLPEPIFMQILANYGGEAGYTSYNTEGKLTAFTKDNNLFAVQADGATKAITNDADKGIVNGSGYTHREEFGIHEGIFISPKGNLVAWYRKNETMVTDYPLVNTAERIAGVHDIKYPMAGMTSENVTLGVYDARTGKTLFLQTGEPKDQYLTAITWDPSEKYVYVGLLNREQNHLKMMCYSVQDNTSKLMFEETSPKWVEPENPLYFLKSKPTQFIWQSERDGFNQLYLYNNEGQLLKQLTTAKEPVTQILGTDAKDETVYYEVAADNGLSRKVYSVSIKNGKTTPLTPDKGTYEATLSANKNYMLIKYSSLSVPAKTSLLNLKNGKSQVILDAPNPYEGYHMPRAELVSLTAADGKTPLNGRIIKPTNFDPAKKYPVIVYVYGGPHAQLVTDSWLGGASAWEYYMAQKGYIMFTMDNRGSANRGLEFENVIHRQLGQEEMKDQMKGVEYLKSLSYVDADRMGVYGWSFGGFMTTSLLTAYPDVFKVGVAGGPVIDWKWYEIMYGERYMDTPQENPDGYAKTMLTDKAKNLKARLLMIHGAQDPVVVMQHSLEFIKACIKEGRQVDYFVYPDHEHNVRGKDRVHLMTKITDYFELHLKK